MHFLRVASQILGLIVLFETGKWLSAALHLPIPGGILGMGILFLLLSTGVVHDQLLAQGASILLKYLSFLFLPLSVSAIVLIPFMDLYGWKILLVLITSSFIGFVATAIPAMHVVRKGSASHDDDR
ncbi:CidA/LrgA family protein [Bacillus sp. JRC01]|nr:CidA/LrgA family protein [Bacillus sp. JRC01]